MCHKFGIWNVLLIHVWTWANLGLHNPDGRVYARRELETFGSKTAVHWLWITSRLLNLEPKHLPLDNSSVIMTTSNIIPHPAGTAFVV